MCQLKCKCVNYSLAYTGGNWVITQNAALNNDIISVTEKVADIVMSITNKAAKIEFPSSASLSQLNCKRIISTEVIKREFQDWPSFLWRPLVVQHVLFKLSLRSAVQQVVHFIWSSFICRYHLAVVYLIFRQ